MAYHLEQLRKLEKGDIVKYEYRQNELINTLGFRTSVKRVGFFLEYKANTSTKHYSPKYSESITNGYVVFADMKSNSNLSCIPVDKKNGFHHIRKISLERLVEVELLKKN